MSDADLIECVQQFDVIWNKRNPNYKNKLIIKNSWNAIGEALSLTGEVCEQRFLNIRHRYAKERRILLDNTRSGSAAYVSKWPHFEACSFLNDVIATRATKNNFIKSSVTSINSAGNLLKDNAIAKFPTNFGSHNKTTECSSRNKTSNILQDVSQQKYDKIMSLASAETTILDLDDDIDNSELSLHDVFRVRHSGRHSDHTENYEILSPSSSKDVHMRPSSRLTSVSQTSSVSESTESQHAIEKKRNAKRADQNQNVTQLTNTIAGAFNKFEEFMKCSQQCDETPAELSDEDFAFGRTVALSLKHISCNKKKLILKSKILADIANATDEF